MNELVTYESRDRIATITINRPDKLNALSDALVRDLEVAWVRFEQSEDRVAILTSTGDRAFSVGADLKDPPQEMWQAVPNVGVALTKPVIAAVTGHCVGGAYILVQHCDLAIASESTKFSYPEAKVGFTGGLCAGAVARIPAKVAMEFLLLGEPLTAQRAYEVGLVNRVVPDGLQLEAARAMASTIAESAPLVVSTIKKFTDQVIPKSPSEQAAITRAQLILTNTSGDSQEGKLAFLEKRQPEFKGV